MFVNEKSLRKLPFTIVMLTVLVISLKTVLSIHARTSVYVANADSREIYVLELNEKNGSLKLIEKTVVSGSVMPLAISPDRKYLFASLRSEPYSVSSFAINPKSGKLTFIKTIALADNMAYISTDRTGRFLFGASYSGNKISVNTIDSSGEVDADPLQVIPTGKNAHCILTDLSNKFLFVSNLGDDRLLQFKFDQATGVIKPNETPIIETKKGAGPRHFVFHPNKRLIFGTNELNGTVNTYLLDSFGKLALIHSNSIMPPDFRVKPWTSDLHLTPDGKFLYASERTTSTIAAFRVNDKSGELSLIGNYPTETQPRGFNISPNGKYLIAAGQKSNRLSVYEINRKTGKLSKKFQMDVGNNPNWIEIITLP